MTTEAIKKYQEASDLDVNGFNHIVFCCNTYCNLIKLTELEGFDEDYFGTIIDRLNINKSILSVLGVKIEDSAEEYVGEIMYNHVGSVPEMVGLILKAKKDICEPVMA